MPQALRAPPFTPAEEDLVLDELRAGASVAVGGSTCHTVYGCRDGAWVAEHFDWGPDGESVVTEDDIRLVIRSHADVFVDTVRAPHARALAAALATGNRDAARHALGAWLAWGDRQQGGRMLRLFLEGPSAVVDADTLAFLGQALAGVDPWHAWMNATGWARSVENARRGADFVATLRAMAGDPPGSCCSEASFLELAGDAAAALACLDADIARLPREHPLRAALEPRRQHLAAKAAI